MLSPYLGFLKEDLLFDMPSTAPVAYGMLRYPALEPPTFDPQLSLSLLSSNKHKAFFCLPSLFSRTAKVTPSQSSGVCLLPKPPFAHSGILLNSSILDAGFTPTGMPRGQSGAQVISTTAQLEGHIQGSIKEDRTE